MSQDNRTLINEYKNYLIRSNINTTNINMGIKDINDIKVYEKKLRII